MSTIRNPINKSTYIDLLPTINLLVPQYGLIANSGLFKESGAKANFAMYEIDEGQNTRMTKLTSRTEREAVKVGLGKSKHITVGGRTIKITDGVHVEDLQNVLTTYDIDTDVSLQQAIAKKTANMYNSWSQSYEYMLLTAAQGQMRDPKDGTVVIDMYAATGTTRTAVTIDLRDTADVLGQLNALRNQLNQLNGFTYGNVGQIDIPIADDVMNKLIKHPDIYDLYVLAMNGRGMEAIANRIITKTADRPEFTPYGSSREFVWENLRFFTYPQAFVRMDGTTVPAVANGKGFTIARGVSDAYEVFFAPAPYFSQANAVGQKIYARSTGIVDDTHIDMTIETHLTPILKRPELSIDLTFTLA